MILSDTILIMYNRGKKIQESCECKLGHYLFHFASVAIIKLKHV